MPNLPLVNALNIAQAGAKKLAALNLDSGQFKYRYDAKSNDKLSGYNVLRHSGTIWSMLDVFSVTQDEELLTAANRAITYLLNEHLRFYRDYNNNCHPHKSSTIQCTHQPIQN